MAGRGRACRYGGSSAEPCLRGRHGRQAPLRVGRCGTQEHRALHDPLPVVCGPPGSRANRRDCGRRCLSSLEAGHHQWPLQGLFLQQLDQHVQRVQTAGQHTATASTRTWVTTELTTRARPVCGAHEPCTDRRRRRATGRSPRMNRRSSRRSSSPPAPVPTAGNCRCRPTTRSPGMIGASGGTRRWRRSRSEPGRRGYDLGSDPAERRTNSGPGQ